MPVTVQVSAGPAVHFQKSNELLFIPLITCPAVMDSSNQFGLTQALHPEHVFWSG
jgi:hypothetical protein